MCCRDRFCRGVVEVFHGREWARKDNCLKGRREFRMGTREDAQDYNVACAFVKDKFF